ncbi:hypothetical protein KC325_g1, partial [Hortaea werneckii]
TEEDGNEWWGSLSLHALFFPICVGVGVDVENMPVHKIKTPYSLMPEKPKTKFRSSSISSGI